jgi:very-long-chain (3R)-3-hydroxyacyl-CoA dehydratase
VVCGRVRRGWEGGAGAGEGGSARRSLRGEISGARRDLDVLSGLQASVWQPVMWVQTAALLEVVHAALGFVQANPVITAIQVASRLLLVWGVCWQSPAARASGAFALMVLSWGLVEVPRYFYLLLNGVLGKDQVPFWLTWLRYSLFAILYPSGILGEILTIVSSLPDYFVPSPPLTLLLPNAFNIHYHHGRALLASILLYVPGSPTMYGHMLSQRRKKLDDAATPKAKAE